ncbi:MAG: VacJ family lipoprotein [Candidatus Kinetoplastibacterium crithidii]|nr:MAG: VacJ family lipoprotein [Candidatus Kinetoplastibacterium crithidii]
MTKILLVILSLMLSGCNTTNSFQKNIVLNNIERLNRTAHKINSSLDEAILLPAAKSYNYITPKAVQSSVNNFFSNVDDVQSAMNCFLQGRGVDGINTVGRFLFNSTMGVFGLFDVASMSGAEKIQNDFGITLGKWGIPPGPYLVIPFIGPSNTRDLMGMGINQIFNPLRKYNSEHYNLLSILSIINYRAKIMHMTDLIKEISIDHYSLIKNAYSKKREIMIHENLEDIIYDDE